MLAGLPTLTGSTSAQAMPFSSAIFFTGFPGTNAPPPTLGPYTMQAFGTDARTLGNSVTTVPTPIGSSISFSPALDHYQVPHGGWATWSNLYTESVYGLYSGLPSVTITLPSGTGAFYFYVESDAFAIIDFTAKAQNWTSSGSIPVNGNAGAKYFGFYTTGQTALTSITVTSPSDAFAVGEFGIAAAPPTGCFYTPMPAVPHGHDSPAWGFVCRN